jgi:hypothetical protein
MIGFIVPYTLTQLGTTDNTTLSVFIHFPVHRYTSTRLLSLHLSYPGNGFIAVSLSFKITSKVLFSQPNTFLAITLQLASRNSILQFRIDYDSVLLHESESESESDVTTDSQSASLSWNKAPSGAYDQIFISI